MVRDQVQEQVDARVPLRRRRVGGRVTRSVGSAWGERGLSETLQWAILTPTLMLVILGIIQAGILMHGHNVAENAAQAAAEAESAYLSAGTGTEQALAVAEVGGLTDVKVTVERGPTKVVVGVSARIPVFFDIGQGRVDETASAPIERVTEP